MSTEATTFNELPIDWVLRAFPDAKKRDWGWQARCRSHEDDRASVSIREFPDRSVSLKCFAGCTTEQLCHSVGREVRDLFIPTINNRERRPSKAQRRESAIARAAATPPESAPAKDATPAGKKRRELSPRVTAESYAEAKALPIGFLQERFGVRPAEKGGVEFPYRDEDGTELGVKTRWRLKATDGSMWERGKPLVPYGREHLPYARQVGALVVPEGESDTQTSLYHGFPALGIPGATATGCLEERDIRGIKEIFAVVEPDKGGETFLQGLTDRLRTLGFQGTLYAVRMPDGIKDISALHLDDPDHFHTRFQNALETAKEVSLAAAAQPAKAAEPPQHLPTAQPNGSEPQQIPPPRTRHEGPEPAAAPVRTAPPHPLATRRHNLPENRWDEAPARARDKVKANRPEHATPPNTGRIARLVGATLSVLDRGRGALRDARVRLGHLLDPDRAPDPASANATAATASLEFAELEGTPKKVKWAKSIRNEFARAIDAELTEALHATTSWSSRTQIVEARHHLRGWLARKTSADFFIDNRTADGRTILAIAASEDRSIARRLEALPRLSGAAAETPIKGTAAQRDASEAIRAAMQGKIADYFDRARASADPRERESLTRVERLVSGFIDNQRDARFFFANRTATGKALVTLARNRDTAVREALREFQETRAMRPARAAAVAAGGEQAPAAAANSESAPAENTRGAPKSIPLPQLEGDPTSVTEAEHLRRHMMARAHAYLKDRYNAAAPAEKDAVATVARHVLTAIASQRAAAFWIRNQDADGVTLVGRAVSAEPELAARFRALPSLGASPSTAAGIAPEMAPGELAAAG